MVGIGRGHVVVEIEVGREACQLNLWNYRRPLAAMRPEVPLIRTRWFGWLGDGMEIGGVEGLGFAAAKEELYSGRGPVVVITRRYLRVPI